MSSTTELEGYLSKQLKPAGARDIAEAEIAYNAIYGEEVLCGFCSSVVRVDFQEHEAEYYPMQFVWLPEGMMEGDEPCHLCVDCLRVNRGLTEAEKRGIMAATRQRAIDEGANLRIALEQAIMAWCAVSLPIAGENVNIRQSVFKQVSAYGEDGEVATDAAVTGQAADVPAASIKMGGPKKQGGEVVDEDGEEVLKL